MIYPRPYQLECVESLFQYFIRGGVGNPLVAMPTGTGKSLIPAFFMQRALSQWPDQRMILLTHVKELVEQNHKALKAVWPTAPCSIFSAGLGSKEGHAPIVLGGVASVVNSTNLIGRRDILFIDESHLLSPNDDSMYQTVITELLRYNPCMKVIGLTATPFRMGQGRLTDPVYKNKVPTPALFTDTAFDITGVDAFNRLIDEYYLSPLIPKRTSNVIDVSDVRELSADFNQRELFASVERQGITGQALAEAYELCRGRKSWIVFGAGIKNCIQIKDMLNAMGVATVVVHSNTREYPMTDEDRDRGIRAFKEGRFQAIVSNNILTTGFDHAPVDAIIDLRPTTSIPLHIQKYGRGTRPYYAPWFTFEHLQHMHYRKQAIEEGGKRNCIVLDFAGNTPRLGPINNPVIPSAKKGDGTGDAPMKLCGECDAYNAASARVCCDCGAEFLFKSKLKATANTADIVVRSNSHTARKFETHQVTEMMPRVHEKKDKPPSLQVTYMVGYSMFRVWLGFESKHGMVKHKAKEWWRQHSPHEPPTTTQEAFDRFRECRKTNRIKVDTEGQYDEILEYLF